MIAKAVKQDGIKGAVKVLPLVGRHLLSSVAKKEDKQMNLIKEETKT